MGAKNLSKVWKEFELGKRCIVYVFRTVGCSWKKCNMCSYYYDSMPKFSYEAIKAQLREAKKYYNGEEIVKIYTSGSFLDNSELTSDIRREILSSFEEAEKIVVESRPEFIINNLESISDFSDKVEVAIGLETLNDTIRELSIQKGFSLSTFEHSLKILSKFNFKIRTYILLKPPFIYEKEAIEDAVASVKYASNFSTVISINPVNIQKNTLVERLFEVGDYDPPWFWSLLEVIKKGEGIVISKPAGVKSIRGIHNCGKCDEKFITALEKYNNSLEKSVFDDIECDCKKLWEKYLEYEILSRSYGIPTIRREKFYL